MFPNPLWHWLGTYQMLTDQSEHPPDVVTLKSQCVQLVPDTEFETVTENF